MSASFKMTRRNLLLASAATAGTAILPNFALSKSMPTRPNIVWVVCHDIHAELLGTYGNQLAKTPVIDKLATDGIRFDNCFSVAPVCSPSRFALVTGMYPDSCGPADQMRGIAHVPDEFKPLPVVMREAGYYCTNNVFTDYNCDLDPDKIWDECTITAHWRNRPAGKPFFCVYNYLITHESRIIHFDGDLNTDPATVPVPPYLPDIPEIRNTIAQNIEVVNRQDQALKTLLDQLEADGLDENTVVMFMADHGGVIPRSKRYCYDEGLHVPFIMRIPEALAHLRGRLEPGKSSQRLVSSVDMAPTTLAIAGIGIPDHMVGKPIVGTDAQERSFAFSMRNRMDERYDMVRTVRDEQFRYIRNYSPHRIYGLHNAYEWQMVGYQAWERQHLNGTLTQAQDRFWQPKPFEELYDLKNDPHQLINLASNPDYEDRLDCLSKALDEHMMDVMDNGLIPEGTKAEGYWPSRKKDAYPIQEVMTVARTGIERNPDNMPILMKALESDNEIVRFWAAQGILMLGFVPADIKETVKQRMKTDDCAHVRCVLAEAIGGTSDAPEAVEILANILLDEPSKRAKLLALESLTYIPVQYAKAARDAIETIPTVNDGYLTQAYNYLSLKLDGVYEPHIPTYFAGKPKLGKPLGDPRI